MPIAKSNGIVTEAPKTDVAQTAPAPVASTLQGVSRDVYPAPRGRDYNAEARGKVACAAFNAALASPGLAMFTYADRAAYLAAVKDAADASVAYTWKHQDGE